MTATTPIYGLQYPEGSDLVSSAPDSFKAMADTFESALSTVDQRSTPAGATPVIGTTLESLKAQTATVGQTGFVTGGNDDNGQYIWDGSEWVKTMPEDQAFNGIWKLDSEIYTGRKWVDGRKIYMQVKKFNNLANNSRTQHHVPAWAILDSRVITFTSDGHGAVMPYLATDTYWHSEMTVTENELILRKGASNTSAVNCYVIFTYTKAN